MLSRLLVLGEALTYGLEARLGSGIRPADQLRVRVSLLRKGSHAEAVGHELRNAISEAADENQRRVEAVFAELEATKPATVSYIVLRLEDDSFVHVSFHDHGEDEVNPISSTAAFAHFLEGHVDRRAGAVDQQKARLVGAYITTID